MLVARGLCGIAAAGVTPSVYALVGATAPPGRRATWVAIVLTGLLSSLSLGAPLGAMTAHQVGWPVVFQVLAAGGLVLALLNHFAWRRIALAAARHGAVGPGRLNAAALGRDLAPTVAWSAALYSLYTYLSAGLIALDYTATQIAGLLIVYGAAAFAGTLLGGRLADRWGPGFSTRASLLGVATCYLLLRFALVWRAEYCAAAALGLTSLVAQTFFPARQSLLMSRFPARISTALAWNNSALFLGMTLGSLIGGHAMAIGGLPAVLTGSIALAITGWAGCLPHPAPADVPETI
jgi:predicted MFS family arabinose efflux permease